MPSSTNPLPETTPDHYLTGHAALNIPTEDGDVADWHFSEIFLNGRARFRVAGCNFPDTADLLGNYGIRECGDILRCYGVTLPASQKIYAANPIRAILDLVVASVLAGQIPHHVTVHDTLDSPGARDELNEQLRHLKTRLTHPEALAHLEQWQQQQQP